MEGTGLRADAEWVNSLFSPRQTSVKLLLPKHSTKNLLVTDF